MFEYFPCQTFCSILIAPASSSKFAAGKPLNETVMDGEGVPMATRQNRLGHSDARTTMRYTHVISEDGRKIAARFGELLTCSPTATIMPAKRIILVSNGAKFEWRRRASD
jgi:hypothetical protein